MAGAQRPRRRLHCDDVTALPHGRRVEAQRRANRGFRPIAGRGLLLVVVVLGLLGASVPTRAAPEGAKKAGSGVDETLKEVILSLEASAVTKVSLERYADAGLQALQGLDRCLTTTTNGASRTLQCGPSSLTVAWPPARAIDVAALLSDAARLVDPSQELRAARVQVLARALARAVDDPYTAYLSPALMAAAQAAKSGLSRATPGIELWPRDPTRIRDVRIGSDAARQGIMPGDHLVRVDGTDVASLTLPEALHQLEGPNLSFVHLDVSGPRGTRALDVSRTLVPENDVVFHRIGPWAYVYVPAFKAGVAQTVQQAIGSSSPRGVILDLRHNPGGYLPEGVALLDLFLRDGAIAGVRSGPGRATDDFVARREASDVAVPLVVLVDGASASASELCAMVLKDRERALVLGSTTAGKGSVQRQIQLPDGGMLKVTAGYYVGPTGHRLDEGGVRPHRFLAPATSRTVLEGGSPADDSWVLSAIDALQRDPRRQEPTMAASEGPRP